MEQVPQNNEQERPRLDIDLQGPDGNVFVVLMQARGQLEGAALMAFNEDIRMAIQSGMGTKYEDILYIVNSYMTLTDTSTTYEAYAPKPPEE